MCHRIVHWSAKKNTTHETYAKHAHNEHWASNELAASADNVCHSMDFIYRVLRPSDTWTCAHRIIKSLKLAKARGTSPSQNWNNAHAKYAISIFWFASEDNFHIVIGSFGCDTNRAEVVLWKTSKICQISVDFLSICAYSTEKMKANKFSSALQPVCSHELAPKISQKLNSP